MLHLGQHAVLGFCWWDLLALAVLAAVVILFVVRRQKMKEAEEELESEL